jgi:hypothetical protein
MKFKCETHKIEVEVSGNRRSYSGLSWAGSPNCALFTMPEIKEGSFGSCKILKIG